MPWWKKTVVYQIYPRSFKDTTNDGVGDIAGIISKLDYLRDLGVETIWLSPFYASPQKDFGYDISDYLEIHPEYGTMDDTSNLIEEIHSRNMKIIFDMVLNHTSDQHPWFLESRSSRDNPKRDWYIWRDGAEPGGKKPPNNWHSMIGGSGWHYDERTDQWYWAQFLPCQPDLNYHNPEVEQKMLEIMRFWLRKGVDGFRLDIINAIFEDPKFRNNPFTWKLLPSTEDPRAFFQNPKYTRDQEETIKFVKKLRELVDEFQPPRLLVGEVYASIPTLKKYMGDQNNGLNLVFLFQAIDVPLKAKPIRRLINRFEKNFSNSLTPTWVFSNHDRMRRISKLNNDVDKAKLNATLQLTARGVPFIYYGEEIGMTQPKLSLKEALDPVASKYKWIPKLILNFHRKIFKESINRDECRTPMQWNDSPNAGFCAPSVKPWLPVTPTYTERNVQTELNDPSSLLNCYRRLLDLRFRHSSLNAGILELLEMDEYSDSIVGYIRKINSKECKELIYVYLNFTADSIKFPSSCKDAELLFSTLAGRNLIKRDIINLNAFEGIILLLNK